MPVVWLSTAVQRVAGVILLKGFCLSAKHKLNVAVIYLVLLIASITGVLSESWVMFIITIGGLVAINFHNGMLRK